MRGPDHSPRHRSDNQVGSLLGSVHPLGRGRRRPSLAWESRRHPLTPGGLIHWRAHPQSSIVREKGEEAGLCGGVCENLRPLSLSMDSPRR